MKRFLFLIIASLSLELSLAQTDSTVAIKTVATPDSVKVDPILSAQDKTIKSRYWAIGLLAVTSIVVYLLFNVRSDR